MVLKKKSNTIINSLLVIILIAGLSLMLYPKVSDYWNSFHQTQAKNDYVKNIEEISREDYEKMLDDAKEYNERLSTDNGRWFQNDEEMKEYLSLLDPTGSGMMGYIEIPSIGVSLPIYHTSDDDVLQKGAGHMPGSSLPIGGIGTHSVLTAHRGLPSATLFSNLNKLMKGDLFVIRILSETYTYEVDQIRIVNPKEMGDMDIDKEKDYCTLATCTPYGVNTHRLLVRGHRVENQENGNITVDASQIRPYQVALALAIPLVVLWFFGSILRPNGGNIPDWMMEYLDKSRKKQSKEEDKL